MIWYMIQHRAEFRLVPNLSEKGNYNTNLVLINKIAEKYLSVNLSQTSRTPFRKQHETCIYFFFTLETLILPTGEKKHCFFFMSTRIKRNFIKSQHRQENKRNRFHSHTIPSSNDTILNCITIQYCMHVTQYKNQKTIIKISLPPNYKDIYI